MFSHLFIVAVAAGYATAQTSISSNCTSALLSVNNDAAASACLSPLSLAGLATGATSSAQITAVDGWLNKICPAAPCSNATLANVVTTIVGGCSAELSNAGITGSASTLIPIVQAAYPTVKQVACLKNGNTNCVTQTLTSLVSSTNQTVSLTTVITAVSGFGNLPQTIACTDCIKASYSIIAKQQPDVASALKQPLQDKCGQAFVDGSTPTGISESASTATSNSNSASRPASGGSLSTVIASLGVASLIAFSSASLLF